MLGYIEWRRYRIEGFVFCGAKGMEIDASRPLILMFWKVSCALVIAPPVKWITQHFTVKEKPNSCPLYSLYYIREKVAEVELIELVYYINS